MMKIDRRTMVLVLAALAGGACAAAPALTAKTSHPDRNFFAIGTEAKMIVSATGLGADERRALAFEVLDFTRTNRVATLKGEVAADAKGAGSAEIILPTRRYGVYYVRSLVADLPLPKVGTAPKGFMTYAVLEDPAKMPDLDPWDAFLGEHCCNMPWLWQRGGLGSAHNPSSNRLIIASVHRAATEGKVKDFWSAGSNPAVADEIRRQLTDYVKKAIEAGPGRQKRRIYETLWEPNLRAPNPEAIVAAQKICWETIHALDPEALVGAYTSSGIDLRFLRTLMEKGLGNYMNAFTVHPYKGIPELDGFVDDVRAMKRILREHMGRDIPMFGTEAGMNEFNTIDGDKRKLCGQLRQAIILLGEGFQMYCPFYGCDFGADLNNQAEGDYGLNYNSGYPKVRFGCRVSQPRPIFGALAAFGRLTEGHRPTCCIEWLAETVLGYALTDRADADTVLVIWDWGARGTTVELPVGRDEVEVADVMGNVRRVKTAKGTLKLALSEYPQYVLHVDPKIWGRAAQAKLRWSERRFRSANDLAPVGVSGFTPAFPGGVPGVAVTLENRTDAAEDVTLETRIPGEPDCRKKTRVTVPARAEKRVTVAFTDFRPAPTNLYGVVARVVPRKGTVVETTETFNFAPLPCTFAFGNCRVRVAADAAGLKVEADVADATPKNGNSGWLSWSGDSLQIGLAKSFLAKRTQNDIADAFAEARCEYTVAKTPLGDEVCRTITWDPKRYPCDCNRGGIVDAATAPRAVAHDGKAWHYAVTLPWAFVNRTAPKPGETLRLAFQYNDRVPDDKALHQFECFRMKLNAPKNFGWFVVPE